MMKNRMTQLILAICLGLILSTSALAAQSRCEKQEQSRALRCTAYRQTTSYTCGPAAAMSLLRYFGRLTSKDMNKTTELRIAKEMDATTKGTSPAQVMSWLSSNGFSVSSGSCVTSSMIKENIDRGIPTIVAYQNHWILAKGYHEDMIMFADSECGTTVLPAEIIDTLWSVGAMKQSYCGIHSGFYITATPR